MKILVISPHPEGFVPGQRLKYEQYFNYFRQNGIEIEVSSFISADFQKIIYKRGYLFLKFFYTLMGYFRRIRDIFRIRNYDGLYIFLYVTPFGFPLIEWIFTKIQPNFVYDIDDLVFLKRKSKVNKVADLVRGKSKINFLIKRAKHVIVCTPFLHEYVKRYNLNSTDISSTVNTDIYRPNEINTKHDELTIGWSGSHSTSPYLLLLEDVLSKIQSKYPVKILVIGDSDFQTLKFQFEAIAWNKDKEVEDLNRIDIGIYPLPSEKWVLGKSGLKAIQYMALGKPTVATAIGANFRVIEHNISGFLVTNDLEWFQTIENLILSPKLRFEIGSKGRERVENLFSVEANKNKYLDIILKLKKV